MNNVLLDELPTSWNGYQVNTWFQIGIQIQLLQDDIEMSKEEKANLMVYLLFANDDGALREHPTTTEELADCVKWFLQGWYHDNSVEVQNKKRIMDFDVDQWRIYADFMQIYHIDLNTSDMHWWMFNGLLWNMPHEQSSFMQVLEIRQKKPRKKASAEERKAIDQGHKIYDLKAIKKEVVYTKEEENAIDDYDRKMAEIKAKRKAKEEAQEEILKEFQKH